MVFLTRFTLQYIDKYQVPNLESFINLKKLEASLIRNNFYAEKSVARNRSEKK